MTMHCWYIYHGSREYAREHGDPCLGVVKAESKAEAERIALQRGMGGVAGVWACMTLLLPGERIDWWKLSPATNRPALPVNGKRNEG